jgi:hypothetical protein
LIWLETAKESFGKNWRTYKCPSEIIGEFPSVFVRNLVATHDKGAPSPLREKAAAQRPDEG